MVTAGSHFVLDSGAVTLAAANTTAGAAGTIKLINGFVNPATSGKWAVVHRAVLPTVSGTPAGGYFWNYQKLPTGVTITSTPTGTIQSGLVGSGAGTGMIAQVNVVVVRSDAATTAFTQLAAIGGPTAVAATGANETAVEETGDFLVVPPGVVFGIAATGAGTSHIVQSTIWWTELAANPL